MKSWFSLLVIGVLLVACTGVPGNETVVSGTFLKPGAKLVLYSVNTKQPIAVDSAYIEEAGNFEFKLRLTQSSFFLLHYSPQKEIILLLEPGETVSLSISDKEHWLNYTVHDSEGTSLVKVLADSLNNTISLLDSVRKSYQLKGAVSANPDSVRGEFMDSTRQIIQQHRNFTRSFVVEHKGSLASIVALNQQYDQRTFVLNSKEDFKYYRMADSVLFTKYPTLDLVKILHQNVTNFLEQQKLKADVSKMPTVGSVAMDFVLPTPAGDSIRLSSLRGKYVLLDFWASWCPPCRKDNPGIVNVYSKYKAFGFEILQVSLDKNRTSWLKAIQDDKLTWKHGGDMKFWDSPVARSYGITRIPANFLIDSRGVIVAVDLSVEDLDRMLAPLVTQDKKTDKN
ncbi:TlpA disulfide reductase family protein [Williamwhitmania taraxaci]|uniref:Peroxiredoxin n=1 Tax=Williamwhitmania taraxaci TaxID=1640674 RepID=A0A1G6PJV2_9BACT|nr:TlpA disulfide reductase family protein [Williamwhitmania taraxaci]SDC79786.1 Peroxiredoxin [Williamwhitmania taraxaci]